MTGLNTIDISFTEEELTTAVLAISWFVHNDECPHCVDHAKHLLGMFTTAKDGLRTAIEDDIRVNGEK